ncbi:tetratricopeptide repeat protein [Thermoflexibacter ruber]|uniref:Serine phosphatase RsbU, regulator of sigma subunit n=1 Tax=Thermoflexibacter ruber TaxID=1003 RepID=A0A1I2IUX3_9BACT|nr:tetratricopeptide repeat protein [Thermoflexibacter ruber]SFF46039.1 Serine phosphatase RsbU, regulator of sigma subunit [Thermoflexibacter ruber]
MRTLLFLLWSIWLYLLCVQSTFAQGSLLLRIDSVKILLKNAQEDTNKVILLSELSYLLRGEKVDSALAIAQQALQLSNHLSFVKGRALAMHDLAATYFFKDEYAKALEWCNQAQDIVKNGKTYNEKWVLGMVLNTFGRIYLAKNNFPKSLEYLLEALRIREEINDKLGIAQSHNYIASVYFNQGNNEQALIYHLKALQAREQENDKQGMGQSYNNIGAVYRKLQDYSKALEYHFKALQIDTELGNQYGIAYDLSNIASVYNRLKEYDKVLSYHTQALEIRKKIDDKQGIIYNLNRIAELYQKQKNLKESTKFAQQAFDLAKRYETLRELQESAFILANNYEIQKNLPKAYEYQKIVIALKDSIFNLDKEKEIANLQANYELEKKQDEIDILNRDKIIQEEELKIKELYNYLYIAGLLILGGGAGILIRNNQKERKMNLVLAEQKRQIDERNEELKQANEELQSTLELAEDQKKEILKKNEDITASIVYAQRIQNAMLPLQERISNCFGEGNFFIFYKPRDIVSGDFYWFAEVEDENLPQKQKVIFAVADCTGHGVPGAFMSMIGNELLNEIVIEKGITSPELILNQLHKGIRQALKQGQTNSNDGMDISVCVIDKNNANIEYAGANNPIYIVHNQQLTDIKADKMPVGGEQRGRERFFTKHNFPLVEGTTIYLFSDGFQDQFGGPENKKFMVKHFRNLLFSMHNDSMAKQVQILEEKLASWKGEEKQTDDITVVGIRL